MIQAATAKMKQKSRSGTMILIGVICAGAGAAGKKRLMIIRATVDTAITIAMKISRRHPARKQFGPMKIPQLLFTEQDFHKFQWRKNRRAEDFVRCIIVSELG